MFLRYIQKDVKIPNLTFRTFVTEKVLLVPETHLSPLIGSNSNRLRYYYYYYAYY